MVGERDYGLYAIHMPYPLFGLSGIVYFSATHPGFQVQLIPATHPGSFQRPLFSTSHSSVILIMYIADIVWVSETGFGVVTPFYPSGYPGQLHMVDPPLISLAPQNLTSNRLAAVCFCILTVLLTFLTC